MWRSIALSAAALTLHAADCTRTSTGFPPLNDPFFRGYQGKSGGLYPNGSNLRPAAHEALGLKLAAEVKPRDAAGAVDEANGRIVLLSIGMSNTTQEFSAFQPLADRDPAKNPRLTIVDGAQGGWSADRFVVLPDPYWMAVDDRLRAAGVTRAQVQAAWLKQADASPKQPFVEAAARLQSELAMIAQMARARFPNLKLMYLSSRIYAGYASSDLNPEPYAYESGFSVKWLIEAQIQGDADLSVDTGKAPWFSWGPYLWADGMTARPDGLAWTCAELGDDGTHPSDLGRAKVARMLLDLFKSDRTAAPWFLKPAAGNTPKPKLAAVVNAASGGPAVASGSIVSIYGADLAGASFAAGSLPLPYTLGGTRVEIGGAMMPLYAVTPGQINFVLAPGVGANAAVVVRDGVASDPLPIQGALYAPGIFTLDWKPDGAAATLHAQGGVITASSPARPGEAVQLFLTGLGVRDPRMLIPDFLPVVRVNGVSATVTYSGAAPGIPGMNQINFVVPEETAAGQAALEIALASATANRVTLAVR